MMLGIIKYLFEEKNDGALVLGLCRGALNPSDYDNGTQLYRRKLRVEAMNGVYQKLVVRDVPAAQRKTLGSSIYRYLPRWIALAAMAWSGFSIAF